MEQLIKNIEQWFIDRGLDKADPNKQLLKFIEETGELASGLARDDKDLIADSIGDMAVVLIGLSKQVGVSDIEIRKPDTYAGDLGQEICFITDLVSRVVKDYEADDDDYIKLECCDILGRIEQLANKVSDYDSVNYFEYCLSSAYNEIKDRKGKLINGVFVKEEDLK